MSDAQPASRARRKFLGFGAAALASLPVAIGLIARPKRSNACPGPVVGGNMPAPPARTYNWEVGTGRAPQREGFGRAANEHHRF